MYAYISINDGALKYHWYNLVKNILRMRTYHVVTQLCTWFYNAAPGAAVGWVVSFGDNSHV